MDIGLHECSGKWSCNLKVIHLHVHGWLCFKWVRSFNNFRALKTGYNLFASGHVQSIHMCTNMSYCFYKAAVLPSMKKEKPYNVLCAIHLASKEVHCAHCSCPAGESQSCVHLSAMLHALECLFETPYKAILVGTAVGESKTSFECTWLKPRKRKIAATCADVLHYIRHEYGKPTKGSLLMLILIQSHPVNVVLQL